MKGVFLSHMIYHYGNRVNVADQVTTVDLLVGGPHMRRWPVTATPLQWFGPRADHQRAAAPSNRSLTRELIYKLQTRLAWPISLLACGRRWFLSRPNH